MDLKQNILGIHHYETRKIVDEYNRVILNGGLEVDANFTFTFSISSRIIQSKFWSSQTV